MRVKHWTKLLSAVGVCALGSSLQAATNTVDFNSDPSLTGVYTEQAGATSAEWRQNGGASGAAGDGYLSLTDAKGSQRTVIVFKDLENGLIVKSFTFDCDLRIGGGSAPPADGFSLNYASVDDPVISGGAFAGSDNETNLPEEGTQTGLGIGFDTWQSATINGVQDIVGISIRVGGQLKAQLPVPLSGTNIFLPGQPNPGAQGNLYVYDPTTYQNLPTNSPNYRYSMQTGATADVNGDGVINGTDYGTPQPTFDDPTWSLWITNLTWEHFQASVDDQGKVKIFWKGNEITPAGGLASGFTPIAGRLIFAARTGGSWEAQHIDNLKLVTQPFTSAVVQNVNGNASGINIAILDQATASLDTNTLVIKVNGSVVTPASVTHDNATLTTKVRINSNPLLPLGTNTVQITFKDNFGVASDVTRQVIVGAYLTADATLAVPDASIDTTKTGFTARSFQLPIGRGPGDANRWAQAERQQAGAFIDPATGLPYASIAAPGPNADGTFTLPVINWDQGSPARAGNFTDQGTGTQLVPDDPIPGVTPGDPNNITVEAVAYLKFPPGYYTLGVNSDDGFRVNFGHGLHDLGGQQLGLFDGGKGSSDVLFDVNVPNGGTFPVRLLWWEGGGGASCEFFYIDNVTGNHILINDVAHGSVITAYTTENTAKQPAVVRVTPEITQFFVAPDADVSAWIKDGDVVASNVSLSVNGTNVTAAAVKTGDTTQITRVGGVNNLLQPLNNTATLIYTAGGATITNTWTFRVLGYGVIPASLKVTADSVAAANTPGFQAFARQIQRRLGDTSQGNNDAFPGDANLMPRPEYLLKSAYYDPATGQQYPNTAYTNDVDNTTLFDIIGYINFNNGAANGLITTDPTGIFTTTTGNPDNNLPGLAVKGTPVRANFAENGNDNIVVEFTMYVQLKAGATLLAFNSDDGFIASAAANPHDTAGIRLGYYNGGRGNAAPLPNPTNSETPTSGTANGNSAFAAVAMEDGIYPIRVLYWEGGGGVNSEFLTMDKGSGLQALVGDTSVPFGLASYSSSTAVAGKAWAVYPPSPTQWGNRQQQEKVGLPKYWGNTPGSVDGGDIYNDSDSRRSFEDAEVGAVFANAAGKTIGLTYDGAAVTTSTRADGTNTAVFFKPTPADFSTGGVHTATLSYEGMNYTWSWVKGVYTNVPAAAAHPLSDATGAQPGFKIKVAQTSVGQPNTVVGAETLLASIGTTNNLAIQNSGTPDGSYIYPYINFNNNLNAGGNNAQLGNFNTNTLAFWPFEQVSDVPFPGIPGTGLNSANANSRENFTLEIFAYLKFDTAGYKKFAVNGDDGWAVTVANPGVTNGTVLFSINRGGGAADIPFSFTVPTPGLYPIRLLYYQGGGGANVEFFSYDDNGVKHLVNDPNDPAAIKAFAGTASDNLRILTATLSGGNLNITWTADATVQLQSADSITGPWTSTGNTSGSASIPTAGSMKFFRLVKAP